MLDAQCGELLRAEPPGVAEALDVVAGFDDALVHGFARLREEQAAALGALRDAAAGSPLGDGVAEAVEKTIAGSASHGNLAVLAGGRAALFGAVHDALLASLDGALGRTRATWQAPAVASDPAASAAASASAGAPATEGGASPETPPTGGSASAPEPGGATPGALAGAVAGASAGAVDNLLGGCRSWLSEVAIAGWRGVDHDLVSAADQAIEALLAVPHLRGLAVLLDGLAAELRASSPVATAERLPARRWADLWTRALLLSQSPSPGARAEGSGGGPADSWRGGAEAVSGRLLILGADVHEHGTAVRVQVHGLLDTGDGSPYRLVRTSVAAAKVDTIVGPAVWRLFTGHPVLMGALAEHRSVEIESMVLLGGGDLLWRDDHARLGEAADPFTTARVALGTAVAPPVPPLDRHPVRIAEPVLVEGYTTDGHTFDLGGNALAVDLDRLPSCGPLTPELVAASSACLGLLRWDGGRWLLQPMAVQATVKRKPVALHTGDWAMGPTDPKVVKAEAKAGDVVAVLRERAGRLLRQ
ncbi:hypothetical protein SAMN05421505_10153 [Sinosporangium album]|uniref:Uncharacterized protein n=1 Tax=Sinosporangium album TaxID=504805 RepID=A0A1G7QMY1_9ACTN|nr:hypothetical protein [Sinosporangium album]SDF99907.1 hypothetical protein SAMN05421505_10153 [Sinosporangium album]